MRLDQLRVPFLVLAILLALALVLSQAGPPRYQAQLAGLFAWLDRFQGSAAASAQQAAAYFPAEQRARLAALLAGAGESAEGIRQPAGAFGFGLRHLWLVDGVLLFTLLLIGLGVILPPAWQARLQGFLTLLFALFVITSAIVLIIKALAELILMVALLLAFPFGTLAYLAGWGHFDRSAAAGILALYFTLKLFIAGGLVLAHQRFLQNLGLVLILILSLVANLIVSLLHGLVPGFLVSITDALAGIVVGILGVILAIILLVMAVPSILAALRT